MEPERILYVNGGLMDNGGITQYMMNYYRHMDRSRIQIDFIVHGEGKGIYDDEIVQLGGKVFQVPVKSKYPLKNAKAIDEICSSGRYKIIHAHMDAMSYVPLKIAKECGIPIRIAHSHNTAYLTDNKVKIKLNEYARKHIPAVATHMLACSQMAGKWLFGEGYNVIPNAINSEKFLYNSITRNKIRTKLQYSHSDIVIGHVGKFEYQKNHEYLIKLFLGLHKVSDNYKLLMIGDGSLRSYIKEQVAITGLSKFVTFVDACENVYEYYNAFDLLCFPSRFEGLSVVMVEAQCNGLQCLASDTITKEIDLTGNVHFLPVDGEESIKAWITMVKNSIFQRDEGALQKILNIGYDIKDAAIKLQNRYETMVQNN